MWGEVKVQSYKLKKTLINNHLGSQKYSKNFAFQLFIILQ